MPLPRPKLGLVVRYGFVWAGTDRRSPPDGGKDRPCLIVDLIPADDPRRRRRPSPGSPICRFPTSRRAQTEKAMTIPRGLALHLRLGPDFSFLYTSYAVEDDWPFDLAHLPGSADRYHHGFVPERFFSSVTLSFAARLTTHPDLVHRR
ncbi:MAG: hypothetical protein ACR2FH_10975 [Caulobacteraceae bacterium]